MRMLLLVVVWPGCTRLEGPFKMLSPRARQGAAERHGLLCWRDDGSAEHRTARKGTEVAELEAAMVATGSWFVAFFMVEIVFERGCFVPLLFW